MGYKLLSYLSESGPRAGVLIGNIVLDAAELSGYAHYTTTLGILGDWTTADALFEQYSAGPSVASGMPLADISLLAPILYPGEIWAAGANYRDHIAEMADSEYAATDARKAGGRPWFFNKSSRGAVIGSGAQRALPSYSAKVDWEIELAVVIGRTASKVLAADALDHVAGYTIANDLSARDFVARAEVASDSPFRFDWLSHKGFDGACPMGPWITPARNIADPQALDVKLWIDGEIMQDSNTKHMIFSVAEQIEEISARVSLHPGDVILTGTPSGVGMGRGFFLKPGQQLRLRIDGIGDLEHGFLPI